MSANTSKYLRGNTQAKTPPFTQAIALSGDRAGSKGTFQFAGFAWIDDTKVTLVKGDVRNLRSPAEWRQLLRLINLAHRLKKPVVLWNLPVVHVAAKQRKISLANMQAIQNAELALLKLPHPILTVFDESYDGIYPPPEPIWNDGVVFVGSSDIQLPDSKKVKVAQDPTEITSALLELLYQAEAIPGTKLIAHRKTVLHTLAKGKTEFASKSPPQ